MKIDVITLFPELFEPFKEWSMIKKAREIKALEFNVHNLRDWAIDERGTVDDRPYGGGPGMIIRPEPVFEGIKAIKQESIKARKTVLLSAKGKTFNQKTAEELSKLDVMILVCGHYEGVDERVRQHMVDMDISIGNYVLSGGEIPAMVVTDTISRLLPGVLEKGSAAEVESFSPGLKNIFEQSNNPPCRAKVEAGRTIEQLNLLEYPQFTRPKNFKSWKVPDVLLSGNHQEIAKWRAEKIKEK